MHACGSFFVHRILQSSHPLQHDEGSCPVRAPFPSRFFYCSLSPALRSSPFPRRSLSFSYGRALQQSTLKAWQGKTENLEAAQNQLKARAQANSEANLGKYEAGSQPSADETLFVKGYKY